jgi:hypothetical protein
MRLSMLLGAGMTPGLPAPLYEVLSEKLPAGYYLVSNTAFPRGASWCPGKIHAPLWAGSNLPDDLDKLVCILAFNCQLLSFQRSVGWGMCSLQGMFGCLCPPTI